MDRFARLLSDAGPTSRIIEIGPSHAPIAPRRDGWNTSVVDHANAAGLRTKYAAMGVDTSRIEEVDFVWAGGSLADAIPLPLHGGFDLLIASHVIEHIPDFVGFFKSLESVMARDGVVSLAVPDKRYCFDVFKPHTCTGDLLVAAGRAVHDLRTAWTHKAYTATYDGTGAWGQHPVAVPRLAHTLAEVAAALEGFKADGPYDDFHAWHFTPAAFALAVLELGMIGRMDWHIAGITEALGCEFIVQLRRGARRSGLPALEAERLALLLQIGRELADGLRFQGLDPLVDAPVDARLARAELAAERARQDLVILRASTSWRITAPLRALAGLFRFG